MKLGNGPGTTLGRTGPDPSRMSRSRAVFKLTLADCHVLGALLSHLILPETPDEVRARPTVRMKKLRPKELKELSKWLTGAEQGSDSGTSI